ncbi:GNAT family N-acetyltransferase [Amnibacterium kyonggiense]|uniref:Acetyltransferase (GNAT) family protein n=1 Tax=Amnibacterium kyonggiense TaxID=595671 RepID=A0A4R7FGX0_9MICO|nr:GNAT family N-acetyltransferase [Amnibacterium kyonggiense]TDS76015.1 acetyltransferase (GNAT) family protein [Amnibacterium kyonggiense]
MTVEVRPATVFDDVAAVIGPKRPNASVCFCLSHRIPAKENQALSGPARGEYVRRLCAEDPAPGVLAYDGDEPVGWAGVAPRSATQFDRSTRIPHIDDLPVWSVWCVRVRPGHRRAGMTGALIEGAVAFAREHGAPAVEAYPVDNGDARVDLTMAFVGLRRWFEAAGFTKAADTTSTLDGFPRVLMRRDLRTGS